MGLDSSAGAMFEILPAGHGVADAFPFGALRSLRDVTLAPGEGERTHHHRNAEVLTWVRAGEMTHRDAREVTHLIPAGGLQRLSSGTGVTHAEYNLGETPARYVQVIVEAEIKGIPPEYEEGVLPDSLPPAELVPLATGDDDVAGMRWNADATVYLVRLDAGKELQRRLHEGRWALWHLVEGQLTMGDARLEKGYQARLRRPIDVSITSHVDALLIIIDLPAGNP